MNTLGDWLAMGGYAGFIWPCYLLAAVLVIGLALQAWLRLAAVQRSLAEIDNQDTERTNSGKPGRSKPGGAPDRAQ